MKKANLSGMDNYSLNDGIDAFRSVLAANGLFPETLIADGKLRRFHAGDGKKNEDGWYVLYDGNPMAGSYGNWQEGDKGTSWCAKNKSEFTREERDAYRERMRLISEQKEKERENNARECVERVTAQWKTINPAKQSNKYAERKSIKPYAARQTGATGGDGPLMILIRDSESNVTSAQYIFANSDKKFAKGGKVAGCYFALKGKGFEAFTKIILCEGYATACSIFEAFGEKHTVVAALSAGNLPAVAKVLKLKFMDAQIVVCAEDDWLKKENKGLVCARDAALTIGAALAIPEFSADRKDKETDFNDMANACGMDAVVRVINAAKPLTNEESNEHDFNTGNTEEVRGPQQFQHESAASPRGEEAGDSPARAESAGNPDSAADGEGYGYGQSDPGEGLLPLTAYLNEGSKESVYLEPFPGVMEKLFHLSLRRQFRQQPALTVAAALGAMSACMHGKYCLPDGLRPNLYIVGLAGTAAGKSGPLNLVATMVSIAGMMPYSNVGSGQGIEDTMASDEAKRANLVIDEVAHLILAYSDQKAAHYLSSIGDMFLKMFEKSSNEYITRILADAEKKSKRIFNPHLTLYGTTTHAKMKGINQGLVEDGTLGRCLIINGEDFVRGVEPLDTGTLYQDLLEAVGAQAREIAKYGKSQSYPNEERIIINVSPEAKARFAEIGEDFDTQRESIPGAKGALLGRSIEQVKKIALVLAVWDINTMPRPMANRVEIRHVEWALNFVRHSNKCLSGFVDSMTDDPIVAYADKAAKIMSDAINHKRPFGGKDSVYNTIAEIEGLVNRSALLRKMKVKSKLMHEIISHMIDAGMVQEEKIDRDGVHGPKGTMALKLLKRGK